MRDRDDICRRCCLVCDPRKFVRALISGVDPKRNVSSWPIGEVAARLAEVRLAGYSGPDLLTLSSSRSDTKRTPATNALPITTT